MAIPVSVISICRARIKARQQKENKTGPVGSRNPGFHDDESIILFTY
jgi:hypothetical protein